MPATVWLEAAINGPWSRARQPLIPITAAEIVAEALACAGARAAILHFHAYDPETGRQRDDYELYAPIIERIRAEELERRRREQARRERALKRHEFIQKKAEEFVRYERLADFAAYLERKAYWYGDEPVERPLNELRTVVKVKEEGFAHEALQDEIVRLQL